MAAGVDNILVKQYGDNITMQVQLKTSKLASSVYQKPNCAGEESYQDQIASTTARKKLARNEVVVNDDPTYDHRKIVPTYYYVAPLIDQMDKLQMMKDPTNPVIQSNAAALARAKDDEIGLAFHATAYAGKAGTTSCSLSGTSLIAAGGTGLTMTKIRSAKKALDANEVEQEDRFFAVSAEQIEDLLAVTEVTSMDYAQVKALVSGQIGTICGFQFVQTERLPTNAASARKCAAYHKNGIVLGTWLELKSSIDLLPGQHFSAQVYAGQSYGATRLEEKRVIQVLCTE
jgi:hypothetical protein